MKVWSMYELALFCLVFNDVLKVEIFEALFRLSFGEMNARHSLNQLSLTRVDFLFFCWLMYILGHWSSKNFSIRSTIRVLTLTVCFNSGLWNLSENKPKQFWASIFLDFFLLQFQFQSLEYGFQTHPYWYFNVVQVDQ